MIRIAQTRFNLITRRLAAVINFQSGKSVAKAIPCKSSSLCYYITTELPYAQYRTWNWTKIIRDTYLALAWRLFASMGRRNER